MDFNEFWETLASELRVRSKFKTRRRSKPFEAMMTSISTVTVTPQSTGIPRNVGIGEFQDIWDIMKGDVRDRRCVSIGGRYSEFRNPAYVCTLIDHVVENQDMK